jgi:imidazolonepropionase-like amidohydrolase
VPSRPWRTFLPVLAAILASGCKPPEESVQKAIIGAVLIDGTGGPPVSDSVVIVAGPRIRAVGNRANMPIPAGVEKIDGRGRFLVPGLIDAQIAAAPSEITRDGIEKNLNACLYFGVTSVRRTMGAAGAAEIEVRKAERDGRWLSARLFLAGRGLDAIEIAGEAAQPKIRPEAIEAALEEARKAQIPVVAHINSLGATGQLVRAGVTSFLGMIRDTGEIDPEFIAKLRDLRIVFAPELVSYATPADRTEFERAAQNTRNLAAGGVLIAVGSDGGSSLDSPGLMTHREVGLLVDAAGLSPMDAIVAATRNGALALGKGGELGTIEPGRQADLMLVSANPLEDLRNLQKIDRLMLDGEWVDRKALKLK